VVRRFDLKFPEPGGEFVMLEPTRAPPAPRSPAAVSAATAVAAAPQPFIASFAANALLGARVEGVSAEMHDATGLPRGVLVLEVAQGSPASAAGLRAGDVIVSAAGRTVHTVHALRASLQASRSESLALTIQRKRARRQVELRW
jgi:serine protease Do